MTKSHYRTEHDSMGELKVPLEALYGAQTQRAIDNFKISPLKMPSNFIKALGMVKAACAQANLNLGELDDERAAIISKIALEVAAGEYLEHFPIDIFQTGSGTSTNMNINEVIANLANKTCKQTVHPNDHINMSQSSNDTIPTTIQVSACLAITQQLLPNLEHLQKTILKKASSLKNIVKTGRTHLMDAMPIRLDQELQTWAAQITSSQARITACLPRLTSLPQGGTAIGTGINAHPDFAHKFCENLSKLSKVKFTPSSCLFEGIASQDAAVEISGQLKTLAVSLMKIANDLRWMNSGPLAGLGEIALPALQPGSSIMPGKVNPVIPEAVCMVAAKVIGNDSTITIGGQAGNFQLNVMLPVIAYSLLESIEILSNCVIALADNAIAGFTVNIDTINAAVAKNPIMVTALNPVIGYEQGAKIAKTAYQKKMAIKDMAKEMTDLSQADLDRLLDPLALTEGGIHK
ncbi:MAG: class II fumarate hydratase [Gammaproteobacteria bacterium]|nr:class II fumarate hydratase [Gammaproteobacteria bacterium]